MSDDTNDQPFYEVDDNHPCPHCGLEVSGAARFCDGCGRPIEVAPGGMSTMKILAIVAVICVIVGVGWLVFFFVMLGPNITGAIYESQDEQALTQMSAFGNAIDMYRIDHGGALPEQLEDLVRPNERGEQYIRRIDPDPWENDYEYRRLSDRAYQITCYGADGQPDTADDLYWPEAR